MKSLSTSVILLLSLLITFLAITLMTALNHTMIASAAKHHRNDNSKSLTKDKVSYV
jgi:hypothetical protein